MRCGVHRIEGREFLGVGARRMSKEGEVSIGVMLVFLFLCIFFHILSFFPGPCRMTFMDHNVVEW